MEFDTNECGGNNTYEFIFDVNSNIGENKNNFMLLCDKLINFVEKYHIEYQKSPTNLEILNYKNRITNFLKEFITYILLNKNNKIHITEHSQEVLFKLNLHISNISTTYIPTITNEEHKYFLTTTLEQIHIFENNLENIFIKYDDYTVHNTCNIIASLIKNLNILITCCNSSTTKSMELRDTIFNYITTYNTTQCFNQARICTT